MIAFKKFAASFIELGVCPGGGLNNRFSTCPSAKTRTTKAWLVDKGKNSTCLIGASCFGVKTSEAPCVTPDSVVEISSKISST